MEPLSAIILSIAILALIAAWALSRAPADPLDAGDMGPESVLSHAATVPAVPLPAPAPRACDCVALPVRLSPPGFAGFSPPPPAPPRPPSDPKPKPRKRKPRPQPKRETKPDTRKVERKGR